MKTILQITALLFLFLQGYGQAGIVATWSTGDIIFDCDDNAASMCFEIQVQAAEPGLSLSETTLRFFYDNALIDNLEIVNPANGYEVLEDIRTYPLVGNQMGFTTTTGGFSRLGISPNMTDLIEIGQNAPTYVYTMCFDFVGPQDLEETDILCVPLVFDTVEAAGDGALNDDGFLLNDAGNATVYIDASGDTHGADDEVIHYLWEEDPAFDGTINTLEETAGAPLQDNCLLLPCTILPIELQSFDAWPEEYSSHLSWITTSETNNSHFEIERSIDGINFETFKIVESKADASGNSQNELEYEDRDKGIGLVSELVYYRLKQVDLDGTFSYSVVRAVEFEKLDLDKSLLFPSPVRKGQDVIVHSTETIQKLVIFDMRGRVVDVIEDLGEQRVTSFSTSGYSSGLFLVVINDQEKVKFIVH